MRKMNAFETKHLRSILILVSLILSFAFSISICAEEDRSIRISFKNAHAEDCGIKDITITPGKTVGLPAAPADNSRGSAQIYGTPSWKPVSGKINDYLKAGTQLTYDKARALCNAYGNENELTLYGTRALSLTYYVNNGSGKFWQLYYYEGSYATFKGSPFETNKAYKGWTKVKNGTTVTLKFKQKYRMQDDLNLYLVTYARVRYYGRNGSKLFSTVYYRRGSKVTLCSVPELSNYRALGWSKQKSGLPVFAAGRAVLTVSGNLDLYASYRYAPYTVKFTNYNGMSKADVFTKLNVKAGPGEYITLPVPPAARDYVATGWSTKVNDSAARLKAGDKVKITKDITYYAIYRKKKTLTIKYVDQDGTTSSDLNALKKTLKEETVFVLPAIPEKVGYEPVCWRITINGQLKSLKAGTKITARGNYCFYANYKRKADAQVILHTVNGKNSQAIYVKKGEKFTFPPMANPKGYTFMGWGSKKGMYVSETSPQTYHQAGTTITINGPTDFYAVLMNRSEEVNVTADRLLGAKSPDVSAYKKIFIVGDSRTERMSVALWKEGINYNKKNVSFIRKEGSGLRWLKSDGYPNLIEAVNKVNSTDKRPIAVVFNHGVNDLNSIDDYIAFYKSIAPTLKEMNCRLFIMSVNPVNSVHNITKVRPEEDVRYFNKKIKEELEGMYSFIDTYTWLMKTGYSTDAGYGGDNGVDDGIHYTFKTYKRIYLRCLQFLAGMVKY